MALCRTCETSAATEFYELQTAYNEKYAGKRLLDLLQELIEFETNMEYEKQMPQQMCNECKQKLINAYDFMMQAREANQRLLNGLKQDIKLSNTEFCLQEWPLKQFVAVKLEPDNEEVITPMEFAETLIEEQKSDPEDNEAIMQQDSESSTAEKDEQDDPLTLMKLSKSKTEKNLYVAPNNCDETSSSDDEAPLMQRKVKLQLAKKHKNNTYACNQCDASFSIRRNLNVHKQQNHSKSHACPECKRKFSSKDKLQSHISSRHAPSEEEPAQHIATISERKKAKELDLNLCKPHGCKLIQCMICLEHFTKINELQIHLGAHPVIIDLSKHKQTIQEIAETFYPNIKGDITETVLLARIQKDLKAEKYSNFYSITNQAGYELRLESSDTDGEADGVADLSKRTHYYVCDLCTNIKFKRRYQLFEHQHEKHKWEEAKHICRRCNARFLNKQLLKHHYESLCLNSHKRFRCNRCPLRFRWKHNIKAHYTDHKNMEQTNICEHCSRSFKDKKSLSTHILNKHTDAAKLLQCKWCNRSFYRHENLLKHVKRHGVRERDLPLAEILIKATTQPNGVKSISCKICQIQFERIVDLKAHIMMELKLNLSAHQNYESLANYSITNEAGFELHLDDSETENEESVSATRTMHYTPYTCGICQLECRRKYEMFQHQRAVHTFDILPHACSKCVFKTVSKAILEHHERTHCQNKEKSLSCKYCSYKFMWPENLEQHEHLHHADNILNIKAAVANSITIPESSEKPLEEFVQSEQKNSTITTTEPLNCPHCDRTYLHQSRLNNHIRDVHSEDSEANKKKKKEAERKYLCSHCGKESSSPSALLLHMRRHTGEKPFKCDICQMGFPRHCEMVLHRRKHTGEKPYHCTVCGKDFARSDKLKRHTLIHSGMKPYKCKLCDQSYRYAKDLTMHMQQHTGDTTI